MTETTAFNVPQYLQWHDVFADYLPINYDMEKNLNDSQAIEKLKELADRIKTCMFITKPEEEQSSRPMATVKAEDDGTLWFYTKLSSGKTAQIDQNHDVHLIYADPSKNSFMDLRGKGLVVTDRQKIEEYWNPVIKAWFPDGIDDPDICLLKVKPESAYYWDSDSGRMVTFLKMLAFAATGNNIVEGKEGNLNL